jgi:hypothetical protein
MIRGDESTRQTEPFTCGWDQSVHSGFAGRGNETDRLSSRDENYV